MPSKPTTWRGARIREARLAAGLKQRELAALIGKHVDSVSGWETGKHNPDGSTPDLERILNIDLSQEGAEQAPEEYTLAELLDRLRDAERAIDKARAIARRLMDEE